MNITNWSIKHSVTIFVFMVILAFAGWKSYQSLPREAQPDVAIPYVMVNVPYMGVAPKDIETLIVDKLEDEFDRLKDVKEINSTASQGMATVMVEFKAGTEMDTALSSVRERVDLAKPELPDDAEDPIVTEISFSDFPIMTVTLSGDLDLVQLKRVAKSMKDDINKVKGILDVRIVGGLEREIRIEANPELMSYYNVSFSELIQAIQKENLNIPGGSVDVGEQTYLVRVPGEFESVDEINDVVVREQNGKPIMVRDVANVVDGFEDVSTYSRLDKQTAVSVVVTRRAGENIIRITDELKALVGNYNTLYNGTVHFTVLNDASGTIRSQLAELENNILSGLLLVLTILMIFLGKWRSGIIKFGIAALAVAATVLFSSVSGVYISPWLVLTLVILVMLFFDREGSLRTSIFVATAIPFSMLITMAVLAVMGITLNIVVLFSLVLALGMLVDNAIVIVENVVRHMTMGKPRKQAAMDAVAEVAWPVVSSTATTVGAFVPLMFWPGIMGDFMRYLPLTVTIVLLASLFVAMVINPVLCANFMKVDPDITEVTIDDGLDEARNVPTTGIYRVYRALLNFATQTTFGVVTTIVASVVALVVVVMAFGAFNAGVEFFPKTTPDRIQVNAVLPEGSNIDASDAVMRQIEQYLSEQDGIEHMAANVGAGVGGNDLLSAAGASTPNKSNISIEFKDDFVEPQKVQDFISDLRAYLDTIPGARFEVESADMGPPTGAPVNLEISGKDYEVLQELSVKAKNIIAGVDGVTDLKSDFEKGRKELFIQIDRKQAGLLGISTRDVASTIRAAVNGTKASVFRQDDDEYDIIVRLEEDKRDSIEDVKDMYVSSVTGNRVKIGEIADFKVQPSFGAIHHIDDNRVITVSSDVEEGFSDTTVLAAAQKAVDAKLALPSGYRMSWTGQNEEQQDAQTFLSNAMLAALAIVMLVLITQFDSLLQTGIIMFSVILSLIGIFGMLVLKHEPFVIIMTGVGVISLAGVVVNNAIVLIDYMNQLRERGLPLKDAVVVGGLVRFRPVLLTALTTVLSLVPTVIGISLDARTFSLHTGGQSVELWGPMADAVVGGLFVSTILVLVVIPAMYVAAEQMRDWFQRNLWDRFGGGGGGAGADLAMAGASSSSATEPTTTFGASETAESPHHNEVRKSSNPRNPAGQSGGTHPMNAMSADAEPASLPDASKGDSPS